MKLEFKLLVILLNLAFIFTFSSNTQASESVKGRIRKINNTYLLVTKNQIAYTLDFTNKVSEQQIQRLNNDDFASVTATFSDDFPSTIHVSSVDYIGLAMLGGVWRSEENLCYDFTGFTKLYVYAPNRQKECVRNTDPNSLSKYTYFINPDVGAWNMLISSPSGEYVGELNIFSTNHVEILLFDNQTDAILGTIVLRR